MHLKPVIKPVTRENSLYFLYHLDTNCYTRNTPLCQAGKLPIHAQVTPMQVVLFARFPMTEVKLHPGMNIKYPER